MSSAKTVDATVNSFRILEQLVDADRPLGVTELADTVGLSKGVVHTHLSTLRELGYVKKRDRKYLPSMGLLALGEGARTRLRLYNVARPYVDNLAQVTGEATTLVVEEGGVGICIYTSFGVSDWVPEHTCGSRLPLHVTAPGKAILASFDPSRIDEILDDHGIAAYTDATITDPETLHSELRTIRENGIAFCRGEHAEGTIGIASSIGLNERGPAAAIGVSGPSSRLSGRYLEEDITGQVISTAKSIQVELTK
ncbi:IclR family transcriptional regulator [Haloferax namakaokahaiae]|uniref:IclR family transcriptional regulator n=1 Tax=Haloferax namakaokahaiae TaxID=1748331 RepID=A0ABD5ZCG0_9EURY